MLVDVASDFKAYSFEITSIVNDDFFFSGGQVHNHKVLGQEESGVNRLCFAIALHQMEKMLWY